MTRTSVSAGVYPSLEAFIAAREVIDEFEGEGILVKSEETSKD